MLIFDVSNAQKKNITNEKGFLRRTYFLTSKQINL